MVFIFGTSFDNAVYMLSGGAPSAPVAKPQKLDTLKREITPQEKPTYTPPTPAPDKLRNVKAYLIQTRKLPAELVNDLINAKKIYAAYLENKENGKKSLLPLPQLPKGNCCCGCNIERVDVVQHWYAHYIGGFCDGFSG